MKVRLSKPEILDGLKKGQLTTLSQMITLAESSRPDDRLLTNEILSELMPKTGNSLRLGITGSPGVGKSSFINKLGQHILSRGFKLAVLAIDPSSLDSKGSIMGDKTRMSELLSKDGIYVRPSPAGKTLGGLASKTREAMLLCEAAGFDYIIIETVGVGQSEVAVKNMVDFLLLLLPPSGGDEIQGIKKGIVESADGIAITKADGDSLKSAKVAQAEYAKALQILKHSDEKWNLPIKTSSAVEDHGFVEILELIESSIKKQKADNSFTKRRNHQLISWMHDEIKTRLLESFYTNKEIKVELKRLEGQIQTKQISPIEAAKMLLSINLS
ncbi:MAG: methylmalonyl Co-A mutase-associated GTPase MeaB [Cyclobacteriaceae bacterium]